VLPLTTGFTSSDLELLRATARCQLSSTLALADRLGTPVLVPVFPRPPAPPGRAARPAVTRGGGIRSILFQACIGVEHRHCTGGGARPGSGLVSDRTAAVPRHPATIAGGRMRSAAATAYLV
jgi:hypothetical protein